MPFKSEAQRKKFQMLVKAGKMTQETYDRWEKETGSRSLPTNINERESLRKRFGVK